MSCGLSSKSIMMMILVFRKQLKFYIISTRLLWSKWVGWPRTISSIAWLRRRGIPSANSLHGSGSSLSCPCTYLPCSSSSLPPTTCSDVHLNSGNTTGPSRVPVQTGLRFDTNFYFHSSALPSCRNTAWICIVRWKKRNWNLPSIFWCTINWTLEVPNLFL